MSWVVVVVRGRTEECRTGMCALLGVRWLMSKLYGHYDRSLYLVADVAFDPCLVEPSRSYSPECIKMTHPKAQRRAYRVHRI
jgi:hypothetical protein